MAPVIAPSLPSSFTPPPSRFRSVISPDPASEFPAEIGRYALYIHLGCPWAHRTNIVYHLKHLQEIVAVSVVSIHRDRTSGWIFDGTSGSDPVDSIEGFKNFKEIYEKSDENYTGGYSVPVLWDTKKKTVVNNDSVGIIRILSTAFDQFLTPNLREANKSGGGLRPEALKEEIDTLGDDIESDINWGTYKCGMAQSQADYDESMKHLFGRFDKLEEKLAVNKYLLGDNITEPDIRLFPTAVRFDMAYYTIFNCNWKQIRFDYPNLHRWLRALYYEVDHQTKNTFRTTTHFDIVSRLQFMRPMKQVLGKLTYWMSKFMEGYAISAMRLKLVPWGPVVPIMPLD